MVQQYAPVCMVPYTSSDETSYAWRSLRLRLLHFLRPIIPTFSRTDLSGGNKTGTNSYRTLSFCTVTDYCTI
jgi:hypothetical protein